VTKVIAVAASAKARTPVAVGIFLIVHAPWQEPDSIVSTRSEPDSDSLSIFMAAGTIAQADGWATKGELAVRG
jgi:hypothetical protein